MKKIVFGLLILPSIVLAKTYELPLNMAIDTGGYLGWKQIFSDVQFDSIPSQPELGLLANLKVTDRVNIFNQFKYGVNINDVLVYNNISYILPIPIDNLNVTFRGGKIRYDNFLYNNTRISPRTRQGVFQPQAIYWDTFAQTATSGSGFAVDLSYKNFTAFYIVDKSTIVNPDKEAKAWTIVPNANDLRSHFGGHQLVTVGYEIPDYGLKTKVFWQTEGFSFTVPNAPERIFFGGEQVGTGIEWTYKDFTTSLEGMCTKRREWNWVDFSRLFCAISPTVEYDITENISTRINYNQYRTPFPPANHIQTYSKDLNLGFSWHKGNWLANIQGDYIQGGRLVDADNFAANPNDYKHFYVIGTNVVWFFN